MTTSITINGVNSYDIQLGNSASKNKTILTTSILIIFQDIIQTQEEYNTLKSEYSKYREETRQEIRAMKVLNVKLLQLSRYECKQNHIATRLSKNKLQTVLVYTFKVIAI